jgi:hypothetical protein
MKPVFYAVYDAIHQGTLEQFGADHFPTYSNVSWMISKGLRDTTEVTYFNDHNEIIGTLVLIEQSDFAKL